MVGGVLPSSAGAVLYRSGGGAVEVEMRVRAKTVVYARVATTLYCTPGILEPNVSPHTKAMVFYIGHPRPDATTIDSIRVPIGRRGGFVHRDSSSPLDETGSQELVLSGRVTAASVRGRFRSRSAYDEECRTGGYQPLGGDDRGLETLHFRLTRAPRQKSLSSTARLLRGRHRSRGDQLIGEARAGRQHRLPQATVVPAAPLEYLRAKPTPGTWPKFRGRGPRESRKSSRNLEALSPRTGSSHKGGPA